MNSNLDARGIADSSSERYLIWVANRFDESSR